MGEDFDLFEQIADEELRTHNMAAYLANIYDTQADDRGNLSTYGVRAVLMYFKLVPDELKAKVYSKFKSVMQERGYIQEH